MYAAIHEGFMSKTVTLYDLLGLFICTICNSSLKLFQVE